MSEIAHPLASDKIRLLFVGRISELYKRTGFLVENFARIRKSYPELELTIVGKISEEDFIELHQNTISLGGIYIYEFLPHEQLRAIYESHDIFILPSNQDPIGAVVLEAMSAGNAILCSDTVGASGFVIS